MKGRETSEAREKIRRETRVRKKELKGLNWEERWEEYSIIEQTVILQIGPRWVANSLLNDESLQRNRTVLASRGLTEITISFLISWLSWTNYFQFKFSFSFLLSATEIY